MSEEVTDQEVKQAFADAHKAMRKLYKLFHGHEATEPEKFLENYPESSKQETSQAIKKALGWLSKGITAFDKHEKAEDDASESEQEDDPDDDHDSDDTDESDDSDEDPMGDSDDEADVETASDRKAFDDVFGKPPERLPYNASLFIRTADDANILIRKSERDLWALTEDGASVVRLYDPTNEPVILERTASVEERDAIRLFASIARDELIKSGAL